MKTLEEIRAFFKMDRFATQQGIVIDSVEENGAVCSVELQEHHNNAMGSAQGGLIFTLADFCFAVASNSATPFTVTLNSTIHFLRPPKGKRLIAKACCVHKTKSTCVYEVLVTDDCDVNVARASATGYIKAAKK